MAHVTIYRKGIGSFSYLTDMDEETILIHARDSFECDRVEIAPHQPQWPLPTECPTSIYA